jgi:hypothetical protein
MRSPWPNFFIVGAQKAGTTSVYHYLRQHPQVFMPAFKEPHYFSKDRVRIDPDLVVTNEDDYLRLFQDGSGFKCIGEASPSYLGHSAVPQRIQQKVPAAKIIILLRDPIDRAYSQYLMDQLDGYRSPSFYDALQEQLSHSNGMCYGTGLSYIPLGKYYEAVKRYFEVFGRSQVLTLLFDDLVSQPIETVAKIATFLEIDVEVARRLPDVGTVYMPYLSPRNPLIQRVMHFRRLRLKWRHTVPAAIRRFVRYSLLTKQTVKPPLDPRAITLLKSIYEPELEALEQLLERPLPELRRTWS